MNLLTRFTSTCLVGVLEGFNLTGKTTNRIFLLMFSHRLVLLWLGDGAALGRCDSRTGLFDRSGVVLPDQLEKRTQNVIRNLVNVELQFFIWAIL